MSVENDRPLRNWNTAMLIGAAGFMSACFGAYVTLSNNDVKVGERQDAMEARMDRLDTEVRYRLDKIDGKVDRLLEKDSK